MTVTRLLYCADPYPATGAYTQVSPKLEDLLLQRMEPLLELDGGDTGSFAYSRLPDGIALISRKDGSSAQALCLDEESADLGELLPIDLWHSPLWDRWGDGAEALQRGRRLDRSELVESLRRAEESMPGRLERFLNDVKALFAKEPGRQVVLIAQADDIACFIQVACESLPPERASRLTFTSRSADPRTAYQQIVGVPDRQATEFTVAEAGFQYRVHDLIEGRQDSPPPDEPDPWARKHARRWLDGEPEPADGEPEPVEAGPEPVDGEPDPIDAGSKSLDGEPEPAEAKTGARTSITPEDLFEALRSTPAVTAQILTSAVDLALGVLPADVVQDLGDLLCENDFDFIEVCGGPLAAMKDARLLQAALRDVDQRARSDPRAVFNSAGLPALRRSLIPRAPRDCVHLRVLAAAASEECPAAYLDVLASTDRVERILRTADLAGVHGQGSALATAIALFWSKRRLSAEEALDLVVRFDGDEWRQLFDEDVLDRLVAAVTQAPAVDDDVLRLTSRLLGLELRSVQRGALSVLNHASRLQFCPDVEKLKSHVEQIAVSLRDRTGDIDCSSEVERWWIDRVLRVLFRPGPDIFWIKAAPQLARCSNKELLDQYVERVRKSPGIKKELTYDTEFLGYVMAVWQDIRSENNHWETAQRQLSAFADGLHGPRSKKTSKAREVASRFVSGWKGGASG